MYRRRCSFGLSALTATGLVLSLLAQPPGAHAHAIESTLERLAQAGSTFELQSRFSNGEPAAAAQVSLVSPSGAQLALGRTDAQGHLRFDLPRQADAGWEVRVDQGPGHRDYLELPALNQASRQRHALPWALEPGAVTLLVGALSGVLVLRLRPWRR